MKVARTDFHDAEVSIDVIAGKKLSVKVPPLKPSVGSLRIVSEPPGARVSVDGRDAGRSPMTVERLSDGPHAVKVTLDDYDDCEPPRISRRLQQLRGWSHGEAREVPS